MIDEEFEIAEVEYDTPELELQHALSRLDMNDDSDDRMFHTRILLPSWDHITDARILRDMRSVFSGFELPSRQSLAKSLNDIDALNLYVANSLKDIKAQDSKTAISTIQLSAAASVRKWALGRALNDACDSHDYGPNVVQTLAKRNGLSVAGLYHIKHVARVLTMKDVYTLGMYDAGWDNIRRLSYISDANIRQQLITAYIANIPDWNDRKRRDTARKTLAAAIASLYRSDYALIASSLPTALAAARDMSQDAPLYFLMRKLLQKVIKVFKKASDQNALLRFVKLALQYFIMLDIRDALVLNGFIVSDANVLLGYMLTLSNILGTYKEQLTSLAASKPTKVELDLDNEAQENS